MRKIYLIDKNTNISEHIISNADIVVVIDIETYVISKKKGFNTFYLGSLLDAKGHKYIAKNTKKYLRIIKNFNYKDINDLQNTYFINFERKIYFFLTNYFYINYLSLEFFKKFNKRNFKVVNFLTNNFNPNLEIDNNNNLYYFFFKKKIVEYKLSKNYINFNFLNKIFLNLLFFFVSKNYLVIVSDDYNLKKYIFKLKKKYHFSSIIFFKNKLMNYLKKIFTYSVPVYNISESLLLDKKKDLNINLQINKIFYNLKKFSKKEKSLSYLLNIYANNYVMEYLNSLARKSINLYNLFKTHKPKLLIAKRSSGLSYSMGEISQKLSFDSILISHASHIFNKNKLSMFDWLINSKSTINSDYKFVVSQSKFSSEFLKKVNVKSKILTTGPIILSSPENNLFKKLNGKRKTILQASTPKNISNFRAINYETIYDYIENIKQQIIALENKKDIFFIIKFREYDFLKLNDFKYLMPKTNNYEIDTKSSLKSLLQKCDYLSSYSSTVIEEALFFGKDIILYDRNKIYKHLPKSKYNINNNKTSKVYYITKATSLRNIFK